MEMRCRAEIVRHREEQPRLKELPHLHCRTFVEHLFSWTVLRFFLVSRVPSSGRRECQGKREEDQ